MITFICHAPEARITCENRKEALNLIRKGRFQKYKTVVVDVSSEKFNLDSARSKEYFGLKETR